MTWTERTTIYSTESELEKLEKITTYLKKQDYFSNETLTKSRVVSIVLNTFYDLFISENGRKKYSNRIAELKKIAPKDNQKILQELNTLKQLQDILIYIGLGNYQNLSQINGSYTPEELRSYLTGDSVEINVLMNRILNIQREDMIRNKQIKDTKRKKR